MVYQIWHNKTPNFWNVNDAAKASFPAGFEHVADVNCDNLGDTFALTNHIESDWTKNAQVTAYVKSARSTSVGDVVVHEDGTRYAVQGVGFEAF